MLNESLIANRILSERLCSFLGTCSKFDTKLEDLIGSSGLWPLVTTVIVTRVGCCPSLSSTMYPYHFQFFQPSNHGSGQEAYSLMSWGGRMLPLDVDLRGRDGSSGGSLSIS